MSTKTYKFWDFRNSVIRNLYVLLHNTFLLSIIFISFVYLNKTIRIISSIVSSDFTETFLFFLLEESAVPKSSIWWGTVTKLGQFTKKKRSRLVRSSLQIPLRNEKRKEVEGGRKSCDRSRNSAGSSPVWEEIFAMSWAWERRKWGKIQSPEARHEPYRLWRLDGGTLLSYSFTTRKNFLSRFTVHRVGIIGDRLPIEGILFIEKREIACRVTPRLD